MKLVTVHSAPALPLSVLHPDVPVQERPGEGRGGGSTTHMSHGSQEPTSTQGILKFIVFSSSPFYLDVAITMRGKEMKKGGAFSSLDLYSALLYRTSDYVGLW